MDGKAPRLEKEETDNNEKREESGSSMIRRVRRSTGVGGKVPRLAVNFKQVFVFFSIFNVSFNFKQVFLFFSIFNQFQSISSRCDARKSRQRFCKSALMLKMRRKMT